MTPAQKKALGKFVAREAITPRYDGIRTDVARALYDGGYLRATVPGGFRAGYAPLQLTMKGREVATGRATP